MTVVRQETRCTSERAACGPACGRAYWLWHWAPALVWSAGLYVASAQPALPGLGLALGIADDLVNYATHTLSYGVLAWLAWWPLTSHMGGLPDLSIAFPELTAFFYAVLYAVSDEIHQAFVPGRTARPWDVLADALGALAAGTLA